MINAVYLHQLIGLLINYQNMYQVLYPLKTAKFGQGVHSAVEEPDKRSPIRIWHCKC